jgi:hypothetical protein
MSVENFAGFRIHYSIPSQRQRELWFFPLRPDRIEIQVISSGIKGLKPAFKRQFEVRR